MMASAHAHHHASVHCCVETNINNITTGDAFLHVVSVELALLSIEQSLRLLLLLRTHQNPSPANHNLWPLYNNMAKEDGFINMRDHILLAMNTIKNHQNTKSFSAQELQTCLKKYNHSYSDIRYFGAKRDSHVTRFVITTREKTVLTALSMALIAINMNEVGQHNIEPIRLEPAFSANQT